MIDVRLYYLQRVSAMVMAPLVLCHIALMIYAVQGGLSAAEILSRTQGSVLWALFYGLFVVAVSVHAAIGVRVIVFETFGLKGRVLSVLTVLLGIVSLMLGMRAVYAVVAS